LQGKLPHSTVIPAPNHPNSLSQQQPLPHYRRLTSTPNDPEVLHSGPTSILYNLSVFLFTNRRIIIHRQQYSLSGPGTGFSMNASRNLIQRALLALVVMGFAVSALSADTADSQPLIVAQDHAWPPFAFVDGQGEPQGVLIDLWREVGERLNRPVEFHLVDWPDTLEAVRSGEAHLHGGLFRSPEREAFMDFSEPLFNLGTFVFIASDSVAISVDDLMGQPVGVTAGSYEKTHLRETWPDLQLRAFRNNEEMVRAATRGEIRAFAADYPVGLFLLGRHASPADFRPLQALYSQPLLAATQTGDEELMAAINKALASFTRDELIGLTQRWRHSETLEVVPRWFWPALVTGVVAILLLVLAAYALILRRQRSKLEQRVIRKTLLLEERHESFRTLFENAAVAFLVHNKDTCEVLSANQRALDVYGVTNTAELNHYAFDTPGAWAPPPYSLDDLRRLFTEVREHGPRRIEWRTLRANGESLWEDVFLQRVTLEGKTRIVSTSVDITEQKRARSREAYRNRTLMALTSGESLKKVLAHVVSAIHNESPAVASVILAYDEPDDSLQPLASQGVPGQFLKAIGKCRVSRHRLFSQLLDSNEPTTTLTNLDGNPDWYALTQGMTLPFNGLCARPIRSQSGNTIGIFMLFPTGEQQLSCDDQQHLITATTISALAIDRKKAEDQLRNRSALEELLRTLSTEFMTLSARQLDAGINRSLARLGRFIDADRCYLFEISPTGDRLSNTYEWCGPSAESQMQDLQDLAINDLALTLERLSRHQPIMVNQQNMHEFTAVERRILTEGEILSMLAVPMFQNGTLRGFLAFDSVRKEHTWSGIDLSLLEVAANLIGSALLRKRLELALEHEASFDKLTELYNRRKFEEVLAAEIRRSERYGQSFCLLLLDIDHFKSINDTYGHDQGDEALRAMGEVLRNQSRETDTAGRWGGEEFVLLLPETDIIGAQLVAETLRQQVENHDFGEVGPLTISTGITAHVPGDTSTSLFKRADQALYQAKNNGRNRTETA